MKVARRTSVLPSTADCHSLACADVLTEDDFVRLSAFVDAGNNQRVSEIEMPHFIRVNPMEL